MKWGSMSALMHGGLEFIDQYVHLAEGKIYFEIAHRFLRSRQLRCVSVGYLYAYENYVIRDNSVSSRGFAPLLDIFNNDPLLLTQEFWDLFSNRVGDEFYVAPGRHLKTIELLLFLQEHYEGFRQRVFAESLKGLLAADTNPDATTYRSFYLGMQPNEQEITGHAAELIALLCSQPSTVVGLAQKQLLPILGELTDHQVHTLVDASQAVLMRTEKKILKSQLRILAELAKARPHLCEQITRIVGQAASTLPVELKDQARHITGKLLSHAADNTDTDAPAAQLGSIPDAVPQHREPDNFFTSRPPIDSAVQAQEILFELLENTGDGLIFRGY